MRRVQPLTLLRYVKICSDMLRFVNAIKLIDLELCLLMPAASWRLTSGCLVVEGRCAWDDGCQECCREGFGCSFGCSYGCSYCYAFFLQEIVWDTCGHLQADDDPQDQRGQDTPPHNASKAPKDMQELDGTCVFARHRRPLFLLQMTNTVDTC